MIRMGYAKEAWLESLCEIWFLCFGDSVTFSSAFFSHCKLEEQVLVLCIGEKPVSMLTILPASTIIQGRNIDLAYLYAVATHPSCQGRGYSTKLLRYAGGILSEKERVPILVPANKKLEQFYRKRGFCPATYKKTVQFLAKPIKEQIERNQITAYEYKKYRDERFAGDGYIGWPLEEISYRLEETVFFGGFAERICYAGKEYGILAYVQEDVLHIKESTIPEDRLEELVTGLAHQFHCKRVELILPVHSNVEGEISLLSMVGGKLELGQGYMNLVLD